MRVSSRSSDGDSNSAAGFVTAILLVGAFIGLSELVDWLQPEPAATFEAWLTTPVTFAVTPGQVLGGVLVALTVGVVVAMLALSGTRT